jgi:hypothetical protein
MKFMEIVGRILFSIGFFLFIILLIFFFVMNILHPGREQETWFFLYQIMNLLTMGVGGYLIKNFTEKK